MEFATCVRAWPHLERRGELDANDMLRAHVLARIVFDAWRSAGLTWTAGAKFRPRCTRNWR